MASSKRQWPVIAESPPDLRRRQWLSLNLLGIILVLMAAAQLLSFGDFTNNLDAMGMGPPKLWAAILIMAELWGAAGFFKVSLSRAFRKVSNFFALFAGSFWFYQTVRQISEGNNVQFVIDGKVQNLSASFFGRFLNQMPGWWTVVEASLLLFWVLYALDISAAASAVGSKVITKVSRTRGKKEVPNV
ncbi:MAG: hypothetical protein JWO96_544 [Candidatus Saccharibacteria bacterium]|nr:hypothetical protein [Candidatus Saccharibacteria bacterium]